ncbi:ABC transporter permease [Dactylosporangium sp. AC04546]|uniref:ABC transporter permease n=1 Tax=Dactylosporangium sp. AC04546 TaxID=2862460 RepID=UPI001EE151FA|nr:ABC transporter permease [Dactylosporangium sp. AC04546]WVK86332.1 ABC transporter permease [Dactylosporangium sp. AC04546]
MTTVRSGLTQGLVELRQSFTGAELIGNLFWPVATLVAIFLLRHRHVDGTELGLGTLVLPGVLGMFVALGMLLIVQHLTADREDGTLLRAKAIPDGVRGYLIGKLVTVSATVLAYLAILLVPGALVVDGFRLGDLAWPTLAWVLVLGLVATQSAGAILGALLRSSRGAGMLSVPILGLIAISGIFYPVTALPRWVEWVAQVFPVYWLGLGMRSALLPDAAAAVEIGGSWRPLETAAVLGAWAVAGLLVAPPVLRRMTRRESGSRVAERREQTLQRVG